MDENCPTAAAIKTKGYTHDIPSNLRAADHYTNLIIREIIISFPHPFNFAALKADSRYNNFKKR